MPVLHLELSVIENDKIQFVFYKKPIANPRVISYTSAISSRIKRDTLLMEAYRRIRNCSLGVGENIVNSFLSKYMNSLRISGYTQPYRFQILKGVLNRSKQIEDEIKSGTRIRYRTSQQIHDQKRSQTGNFPNTWFLKGDTTSILKIPCTPNSKLVNLMREKIGSSRGPDGGLTKFVEMGGLPISLTFPMKEYLTGTTGCQFEEKCLINDDQDCRITRAVYRIICKTCEDRDGSKFVYLGTTGFSMHKRMMEHSYCARTKKISNALGKHSALHHVGENTVEYVSEIIQGGIKYNLERFIFEAIEIEEGRNNPVYSIMNSRSEWGGRGLPRIQVVQ